MAKSKYHENLSRFLTAGYRMAKANSTAKKLTDAQNREERQKLRDELGNDLEKYGLKDSKK